MSNVPSHDEVLVVNASIAKTIASIAYAYAPYHDDLTVNHRTDPSQANMFIVDVTANMHNLCILIGSCERNKNHSIDVAYINNLNVQEFNYYDATLEQVANTMNHLFNK